MEKDTFTKVNLLKEKFMLSIIIIEYHSLADINNFILNVKKHCYNLDYEIIVSSNSMYNMIKQEEIKKTYSDVTWIFNEKNGGFAYGMNRGMKIAKGNYILISNPDVKLLTTLDEMIMFMDQHLEIGLIGPQILDKQGNVQESFRNYITLINFISRHFKRIFKITHTHCLPNIKEEKSVDWIIGAFMLSRKEIFEKTDGLDENYFLYCEDMDWCTRVRQLGYDIIYYPKCKIEYVGSRSARSSLYYAKIFLKSLFRYWNKFGYFTIESKTKKIYFQS